MGNKQEKCSWYCRENQFLGLLSQHTDASYNWVPFVNMTSAMKIVNK